MVDFEAPFVLNTGPEVPIRKHFRNPVGVGRERAEQSPRAKADLPCDLEIPGLLSGP